MPSSRRIASSIDTLPSPGMVTVWRLLRRLGASGAAVCWPTKNGLSELLSTSGMRSWESVKIWKDVSAASPL
jgi:hypothetical protein